MRAFLFSNQYRTAEVATEAKPKPECITCWWLQAVAVLSKMGMLTTVALTFAFFLTTLADFIYLWASQAGIGAAVGPWGVEAGMGQGLAVMLTFAGLAKRREHPCLVAVGWFPPKSAVITTTVTSKYVMSLLTQMNLGGCRLL